MLKDRTGIDNQDLAETGTEYKKRVRRFGGHFDFIIDEYAL